jgi:Domain of unknown function (DUF4349)
MGTSSRRPLLALLVLLVLTGLVLAGCDGTGRKSSSDSAGAAVGVAAPAGAPSAAASAAGSAGSSALSQKQGSAIAAADLQTRAVVRTAVLGVQVADADRAADSLTRTASALGGRVDQDDRAADGSHSAQLVLRLEPGRLDEAMAAADKLGHETSRTVKGQDVTASAADIGARVAALQTSVKRLQALLGDSANLSSLISLESQLTQRQASLDSTVAQQRALADQVALATLTVNFSSKAPVVAAVPAKRWRLAAFSSAFAAGGHGLLVSLRFLLAGAGYVLPFALVTIPALAVLMWLARRRRGRLGSGAAEFGPAD